MTPGHVRLCLLRLCIILSLVLLPKSIPTRHSGMCIILRSEKEQIFQANSLSGACTSPPPPRSEFRVKVFLNFSLPAPCPSPQESAQSAADTASQVPSPAPSDFHPIRRRPHRKQTPLLGFPETRGPAPGVVVNGGRGGGGAARNPAIRRFFWRVARLRGVTLRFLQAGGGGGGGGRRDSRARAARG